MSFHHKAYFNTPDSDHDDEPDYNCAVNYKGGWWYKNCYDANLNGIYGLTDGDWAGICLHNRNTTEEICDITFVEMKLREVMG
ncbi:Tenascin-X [Holothuria leucospilota]|uniref:Tenascin-X n=1 Tax=Holothuria leucospilota TaxID=206669 RepID=A0A9Q1HC07_HOLLE|nr:Tenascin-X [Holothuria leucospilota]